MKRGACGLSPRHLEATGGIAHSPVALTETGLFEVVRHYLPHTPTSTGNAGRRHREESTWSRVHDHQPAPAPRDGFRSPSVSPLAPPCVDDRERRALVTTPVRAAAETSPDSQPGGRKAGSASHPTSTPPIPRKHFATWHHLRRIRAKAVAGAVTRGPVHSAKQEITETERSSSCGFTRDLPAHRRHVHAVGR